MDFNELLINARKVLNDKCKACPICNGISCKNKIPGPGAKGEGLVAISNYNAWSDYKILIDTLNDAYTQDTTFNFFGDSFKAPIFVGPIAAVKSHYSDLYTDKEYNEIMIKGAKDAGIMAFTGDGLDINIMDLACKSIKENSGIGVPTIKPWNILDIKSRMDMANSAKSKAIAMDIDAAGLPFLKNMTPRAGSKTEDELKEIISYTKTPFIVKGIMTLAGARKAYSAGASGIVISNHGGRVLDEAAPTAYLIEEIAKEFKGKMLILVDGGIRSGASIFKALALGADAVIIARPYAVALYGAKEEGIKVLTDKLISELKDTMSLAGAKTLKDINKNMIMRIK